MPGRMPDPGWHPGLPVLFHAWQNGSPRHIFFIHLSFLVIYAPHAERIYRAIEPELSDEVNPRSTTQCWLDGTDTLFLKVEAQDTAALRAALNMYLRLVSVADEMQQLI